MSDTIITPPPVDPIVQLCILLVQSNVLTAAAVNTAMANVPQAQEISAALTSPPV